MSVLHLPSFANCPVCGRRPIVGACEPWPRNAGPQPWYAVCYYESWDEDKPGHCIGVNGFSQRELMNLWNAEVNEYQQLGESK